MKISFKSILVAACALFVAGAALGQTDRIGIYTDESATGCNLSDIDTQVHTLYVVFTGTTGLTAVEFQLEPYGGAGLNFMGQKIPDWAAGAMGRADTGVAIALGKCVSNESVLLLTVVYLGLGGSDPCSQLRISHYPGHANGDLIRYITCSGGDDPNAWAEPGHLTINPDDECACETDPEGQPSPVATSTWGGIKAMYVD